MPFLGANRTALIAGWGPQGPNYKASITFPMVMALDTTGVMPKYSVQRNNGDSQITNTNFFDGWTAATIDNSSTTGWNRYSQTIIYCMRFPTDYFADTWPTGGTNTFQNNQWREDSASETWSDNFGIGRDSTSFDIMFEYSGNGAYTNTNLNGQTGGVLAADLEDRWISILISRGPVSGFANYTDVGNGDYGCRVHIRDAITGELLYARDMQKFSWSTDPPDGPNYSGTITASDHNSTTTLDWRCDQWNLGYDYTGNIDFAQIWLAPFAQIDPSVYTTGWVSNGISSIIAGKTAWIHGTFSDIQYTDEFGFTYISTSPTDLASQDDDRILVAGGGGVAQFPFTNTVYPGS